MQSKRITKAATGIWGDYLEIEFFFSFQGWTTDPGRDARLEYRLSIYHARVNDTGTYTCTTPQGNSHTVGIVVKEVRERKGCRHACTFASPIKFGEAKSVRLVL